MSEPNAGKWIAGKNYAFSAKCTMLTFELQRGDAVYYNLFEQDSHKYAECAFAIPIPGYSDELSFSPEEMDNLKEQAR